MSKNYTLKELAERVELELPIEVLLNHIIENKLFSKALISNTEEEDIYNNELAINKFLLSQEITDLHVHRTANRTNIVCPFHDTKSNDSTYYKHSSNKLVCLSANCKVGALNRSYNVIDLYQMLVFNTPPSVLYIKGNTTFPKAVRACADIAGIEWNFEKRDFTPEEKKAYRRNLVFQNYVSLANEAFLRNNDFSRAAREYFFYERGFGKLGFKVRDIIRQFKIGYVGGKYGTQYLYKIMKKRNFTDEELLDSGLFRYRKDFVNGEAVTTDIIIDGWFKRLIFPYERSKNVIDGVYGRDLTSKETIEKARKSMTPEKFEDFLKKTKRKRHMRTTGEVSEPVNFHVASSFKSLILVEGEIDFLTLFGLGFENTIPACGTNGIKPKTIDLMKQKRYNSNQTACKTIYICFDKDDNNAGENAMFNLGKNFLDAGFDVRVVLLENGDPNDLLIRHGLEAKEIFQSSLNKAISFEAFATSLRFSSANLNSFADIRQAINDSQEFISSIPKNELLWIVLELIDLINQKREIPVDSVLILASFGLSVTSETKPSQPIEQSSTNNLNNATEVPTERDSSTLTENSSVPKENNDDLLIGEDHFGGRNWIIYFDDKQRYLDFLKFSKLENIVFSKNPYKAIRYLSDNHPHIKNILVDSLAQQTSRNAFVTNKLTSHLFECEDLSSLNGELNKYIVKI